MYCISCPRKRWRWTRWSWRGCSAPRAPILWASLRCSTCTTPSACPPPNNSARTWRPSAPRSRRGTQRPPLAFPTLGSIRTLFLTQLAFETFFFWFHFFSSFDILTVTACGFFFPFPPQWMLNGQTRASLANSAVFMSSVPDWHNLMVVSFSNKFVISQWNKSEKYCMSKGENSGLKQQLLRPRIQRTESHGAT